MHKWYVVNVQPRAEARTEIHLRNQSYTVFFPKIRTTRRHARKTETVTAPLFPGYLFVRMDIDRQPWAPINGTRGVLKVLCQQGKPAALAASFIEPFFASLDEQGYVDLPAQDFRAGQSLRITEGPFADHIGTLIGLPSRDRVAVLLNAFAQEVTTTIHRDSVVPVS